MSSGTRIKGWAAGSCSRLEDRLARDPAAGRLAAQPRVHRRADVGELALVHPARRVFPGHVCEQEGVLTRMVGGRCGRVAAMIPREDQQVAGAYRVEEILQAAVE